MKNLRLLFVIALLSMFFTQNAVAQEKNNVKKEELVKEKSIKPEMSKSMHQELASLRKAYKEATPEERLEINKKVQILKEEYNKQVKNVNANAFENSNDKKSLESSQEFIKNAKERIELAKARVKKAEANGEMTEEEVKAKKSTIAEIEEKLMKHEQKLYASKEKL